MRIIRDIKLSKRQEKAVELAAKSAASSPCHQRHGAVLINKGNSLINIMHNSYDYSSFGERFNKRTDRRNWAATRHAELAVCLNIPAKLTHGGTIYVVRVNGLGDYRNSKPCEMCMKVMEFCGIKKVIFSENDCFSLIRV